MSAPTNINKDIGHGKPLDERLASLKKYLMELLSRPNDEVLMRTLSILTPQEIYILSLMATMADYMKRYDEYNAGILETVIRNHLLLKISEGGAGRKDLKDILNPFRVYSLYHPTFQPYNIEEIQEKKQEKKSFWKRLFG